MLSSVEQHRNESPVTVRCMIVTVSDTRTPQKDKSGALLKELLESSSMRLPTTKSCQMITNLFNL